MSRVDVVKFGSAYCAQNAWAAEVLGEVLASIGRNWRGRSGRNAVLTRKLREAGLVVLTATSVRAGPRFGRASGPRAKPHRA
jgi:hypothetical protein